MTRDADVVIVGAGIAGGALATALARNGISALLLEKSLAHQDRVRGEFVVAWGVAEADTLGVLDVLMAAGGHYTPLSMPYGENAAPEAARNHALDLSRILPGVRGPMNFGHPRVCQALDDAAQAAGADLRRGVQDVVVTAGTPPKVAFTIDGRPHEITPRLVVGADGRGSAVARQIGARTKAAPEHHLLAGMLVEGVEAWPEQEFCIGTEGDIVFYVFPQGGGRVRLYICHGLDQPRRFAGAGNARRFLDAFRLHSLPDSEILVHARPAGPCHGYPNADTWVDMPLAPGVVLIGDAAGHNDPTIGQGLSIALRDALLVLEILLGNAQWTSEAFSGYVQDRRERMRRLRFAGQQFSILRAEFTHAARARRQRVEQRIAANPNLALPLLALHKGPFGVPDRAFEQATWDRMMN